MERVLTVAEMRDADEYTIKTLGVSREILTERAGIAVAEEITKRFKGGRVLVCTGRGNNGKDGAVIAKVLSTVHGFSVSTFSAEVGFFKIFDKKFDIIVDCLLGTGLNRELDGRYKKTVEKINESGAFVVSCDIPSGINGDNGKVNGVAVKADLTVAVQEYKLGHFLNDGADYSGKTVAKDIGISVWTEDCAHKLTAADAAALFPERPRNIHKGLCGKVAIVGGSKKFSGSVLLAESAFSAYKTGAGYVTLAVPDCVYGAVNGLRPECTFSPLKDDGANMEFDEETLKSLLSYNAIAFGMGAGVTENVYSSLKFLLENYTGRLVIDADGLNALSTFGKEILKNKRCETVLTPHIGEFCRLSGKTKAEVLENSISCAKEFAREFGVTLILKNAVSVITDGNKTVINVTGDSAMAKAGSGDILSGFTAGLLLRREEPVVCAAVSAYLFGIAGELAAKKLSSYCVSASDLVTFIPEAVKSVIGAS